MPDNLVRVPDALLALSPAEIEQWFAEVLICKLSAISDISTADATDLASAIALANVNKAKINEMLAELRAANALRS